MKPSSPIARNVAGLFSLQFVVKALSAVWTFYLARRLGVASYGLWANILSLIAIFGVLQGFGILGIVVKEVGQDHSRTSDYFGASMAIYVFASLTALIATVLVSFFLGYGADKILLSGVAALSFVIMAPGLASQSVLYGHEEFIFYNVVYCAGTLVYMVLGAVLVESGMGVLGVFAALCGGYGVMSAVLFWKTVRKYGVPAFRETWVLTKYLVRLGFPLVLTTVLTELMLRADRILIDKFWGESAVGYYHAAFNVVYLPREVFYIPLVTAVYTRLCFYHAQDRAAFEVLFERVNVVLLLIAVPAALFCTIFPGDITALFYGAKYAESAKVLPVLAWMLVPLFVLALWQNLFIIQNRTKAIFWTNAAGTAFSLGLNLFLLPRIGLMASALTAVGTQVLMLVLTLWLLKGEHLFKFAERLPRILLAVAVPAAALCVIKPFGPFSKPSFFGIFFAGLLVYGLCVWIFRAVTADETDWMRRQVDVLKLPFQNAVQWIQGLRQIDEP